MNLLFDFITLSDQTGTGVYTRRVLLYLLDYISNNSITNINLYALYDSTRGIAYSDLCEEKLSPEYGVIYCDICKKNIDSIIKENNIDRFFIACAQYVGNYPHISEIKCEVICVTHDLCFEEWYQNNLNFYFYQMQIGFKWPIIGYNPINLILHPKNDITRLVRWIVREVLSHTSEKLTHSMNSIVELVRNNEHVQLITVSDYTRTSFLYNFGIDENRIKVLWSPEREHIDPIGVKDPGLKKVLEQKIKYLLMVSANRSYKNGLKVLNAFRKFSDYNNDYYIVTVGYGKKTSDRHIDLNYLSDSDLSLAFANCNSLIYPSFFEGFGYPPLEAMKYNKPVLISNTTSLPDIFGDAPIYFSPLYETSIFEALQKFVKADYANLSYKSRERYELIKHRQDADLKQLVSILIS